MEQVIEKLMRLTIWFAVTYFGAHIAYYLYRTFLLGG